jgi:hypothetical protein
MSDRRFRLASVLRVRRLQADAAQQRTMLADLRAREARAEASRREQSVVTAAGVELPRDNDRFVATRQALLAAAASARAAHHLAVAAAGEADATRIDLAAHRRRVDVLESLEERHDDIVRRMDDRRAEGAAAEQALVRWSRNR